MMGRDPIKLVLGWHMHQPDYRDPETGNYQLPWTYLHTIKDYVDMAAHLEAHPQTRAVINFVPVLLEQIADYAARIDAHLQHGNPIPDPLLARLAEPEMPREPEARAWLIQACRRAHPTHQIARFAAYESLVTLAGEGGLSRVRYLNDQYLTDLLVWYHLAWLGESVRRADSRIQRLIDKAGGFDRQDRAELLRIIGELMGTVLDRYRLLAGQGRIELSFTPYTHPIMPLLLDLHSAREAMPDVPLPERDGYPHGEVRVRWQLQQGIETFERHFGYRPRGCWPSEGGVSEASVRLIAEYGIRWTASGGNVLHHSLAQTGLDAGCPHRAWRLSDTESVCFFRDDGLSDLIGFNYSDWHADHAVADLIGHLMNIRSECEGRTDRVVSIILDGENAWEHYPENGYDFLEALYRQLGAHAEIELTTYAACLDGGIPPTELPRLVAGSWVYGTFSTWIGEPDKNRAWEMLIEAKHCFDTATTEGRLTPDQIEAAAHQLACCEGSDWCWWFGDVNAAESVRDFDQLYRRHLTHLYRLLDEAPPEYLSRPFTHGTEDASQGGAMRRGRKPE